MWKRAGLLALALNAAFPACAWADDPKQEPKAAKPPTFKAPKGWETAEAKAGFVTARFRAGEGEKEVAVTLLKAGGGLPANINRWRAQLGLKALGDAEALQTLQPTKVDGIPAHLLDIVGPVGEGKMLQRIVVVIIPQGDAAWFVRMSGLAEPVGKQKGAFDEFVKSLRFEK